MLPRLLLLFTVVPLIEVVLLTYCIGFRATIILVIVTGILGAILARHEGMRCWNKIREKLAAGQPPGAELIEGPMILLAGAFLITPGVLTDFCGLLLLVPPVRKAIASRLAERLRSQFTIRTSDGFSDWTSESEEIDDQSATRASGDEIIDVTFTDPDEHTKEP